MAANARYCKYNCDYMCAVCLEAERNEARNEVPKLPGPVNPLVDDDEYVQSAAPGWMGSLHDAHDLLVDDYGELQGFPLRKYDMVGQPINTGTSYKPYVPPPLKVLKEQAVVHVDDEVYLDSPPKLVPGEIIT